MGIKKDSFGAAVVTSIGAFGFQDAVAPFTGNYSFYVGFANAVIFISACTVH